MEHCIVNNFYRRVEIVYETKMCEDFPLTFFNFKLIKQQKSKLESNYPLDSVQTLHLSVSESDAELSVCVMVSVCLIKITISMFKRSGSRGMADFFST